MKRRTFLQALALSGAMPWLLAAKSNRMNKPRIGLLRHATLVIEINNLKLLIDPMLSPKDAMDPVQNCGNETRIPMVDLPMGEEALNKILAESDAVVVTHTHRDHWDAVAQKLIDRNKLIFCQPVDAQKIREQGFKYVQAIDKTLDWKGITIHRTGGRHGTGEIGKRMGEVSGFVFVSRKQSIYLAGDSIWCEEVENALSAYKPDVAILNAGGAKFLTGDPITMTPEDIMKVVEKIPASKIMAVHMDTINHCLVRRTDLAKALSEKGLTDRVIIPEDGEVILI